jgi:hypothetical protein
VSAVSPGLGVLILGNSVLEGVGTALHLCQVVRLSFTPEGSPEPRLIELHVDAGSGAIIGGDQTS